MTKKEFREWIICRLIGNVKLPSVFGSAFDGTKETAIKTCQYKSLARLMDLYIANCCYKDECCIIDGLSYFPEMPINDNIVQSLKEIAIAWGEGNKNLFYQLLNKFCKNSSFANVSIF